MPPAAARSARPDTEATAAACFSIHAWAEPGVMPRVLELFAKRGLVPSRWHSAIGGPGGGELTIDIHVQGLDGAPADYVAACLRQVLGVEAVLAARLVRSESLEE